MSAFLDQLNAVVAFCIDLLWGTHTFVILLGLGLLFTIWSKFVQFYSLTHGFQLLWGKYDDPDHPGAISHFEALSAALSGTVGLGNIGGVALAIQVGGPGALFWMWVTGALGMAIKTVEVTLAMLYRDTSDLEHPHGGAMWVVKRGLGDRFGGIWKPIAWWIGALFCVTLMISTFTGGNMFQAWNVGDITQTYFGVPSWVSGLILMVATALVILGGIKRIGDFAGKLVPLMCGLYLGAGIIVLIRESANVPELLLLVVRSAFSPTEAQGAFVGAGAWFALKTGLRRALFSNEAGQGTSPLVHSAARTKEPVSEGIVAGLEPFVDTCLVCTLTALVILSTNTWNREEEAIFTNVPKVVAVEAKAAETNAVISRYTVDPTTCVADLKIPKAKTPWKLGDRFFVMITPEQFQPSADGEQYRKLFGTIVPKSDWNAPEGAINPVRPATSAEAAQIRALAAQTAPAVQVNEDETDPSQIYQGPSSQLSEAVIQWDDFDVTFTFKDNKIYRDYLGASLTGLAFDRSLPGLGMILVTVACWLFAYSTLISWSYYGEMGMVYLFGRSSVGFYRVIYCAAILVATLPGFIKTDAELGNLADLGTGCMLFANVPIILLMSYQAMRALNTYVASHRAGTLFPSQDNYGKAPQTPDDNPQ